MDRFAHARRTAALDAEADCHEIYRTLVSHEFPWDMNQALSFALFRTYAVPSIGGLLARTGEFEQRTQKRYEDTALLLDAVLEHGPRSPGGLAALRRINAMHRAHDISPADLRYVLTTFVVSPDRWLEAYGWRRLTEHERTATAHYWYDVGRLMGIPDLPRTWQEMTALHDAYEAEHFAPDAGARRVADATLALLATLPPFSLLPARLVRLVACALMDAPLRQALGYPAPPPGIGVLVRNGLRLRGRVVRFLPPRVLPLHARDFPSVRGYPDGYDVAALGTFPRGCPVQHSGLDAAAPAAAARAERWS